MNTNHRPEPDGAAPRTSAELAALVAALGTGNSEVVATLFAAGVRATTAPLVEWLPAVEVCWVDGASVAERHALRVQYAADDRATTEGLALVDDWLSSRPAAEVFRAAKQALRVKLSQLDDDPRDHLLDAILSRCEAAGRASGAEFGVGAFSAPERAFVGALRAELAPEG